MNNPIQLLNKNQSLGSKNFPRRGVAPVIATLLLVAIAVVGGSIIFVFAQGFFSSSQVSGTPTIELIEIIGYDARDVSELKAHDGIDMLPVDCCGEPDSVKSASERITIYLQNQSVQQVFFTEILISGEVYEFTTYTVIPPPQGIGKWDHPLAKPQPGQYLLLTGHDGTPSGDLTADPAPKMEPGEIITVLIDLDLTYNLPRDAQFKLTTTKGNVFVSTIIIGQSNG